MMHPALTFKTGVNPRTSGVGFLWLGQRSCNTAACAVGLACDSGVFADDGLSYEVDKKIADLPQYSGISKVGAQ